MALTTVNITGTFNFPDASWAQYTAAEFMISGYDTDTDVVVPNVVNTHLGALGELDVDLWGNDDGVRGTVYRVNIVIYADSSYVREAKRIDLGRIQIQGNGPLDIADLLDSPVSVPGNWYSTITESQYDEIIAAYDAIIGDIASIELRVPTDYLTIQGALDRARSYLFQAQGSVRVIIESGQEWDDDTVTLEGDYTGVTLESEDFTVNVPAGFPSGSNLVDMSRCIGLKWFTQVDMNGAGRNGIYAPDASCTIGFGPENCGVSGAGGGGISPSGANLLNWGVTDFDYEEGLTTVRADVNYEITSVEGSTDWSSVGGSATASVGQRFTASISADISSLGEVAVGPKFINAAGRNIWNSYTGRFSGGKYANLRNSGSDPAIGADHAALFNSRGSIAHADNCNFSGSAMGVRCGRGIASFRDGNLRNIPGYAVFAFEGGIATGSRGDFTGSGLYDAGGTSYSVLYLGGSSENRPQGGGLIQVESSTFDDADHDIAVCLAGAGQVVIDNSSGVDIEGAVAVCSGGFVFARAADFTASLTSHADQLLQAANDGDIEALGATLDANGVVDHIARVSDGGRISLKGTTLSNAAVSVFDFGTGGGEIYVQETTIDGTEYWPNGVRLGDGAVFDNIQDAIYAVGFGFKLADGKTFRAGGFEFAFEDGATLIPGLPGVVPAAQDQQQLNVYVSASGTGNGMAVGTPCGLDDLEGLIQGLVSAHEALHLTVNFAAGTYTPSARIVLDGVGWDFGDSKIIFAGPDTAGATPTAIIDGQGAVNNFVYKDGAHWCHLVFNNLYLQDFTDSAIDVQYNTRMETENLWGLDNTVSTVRHRGGQLDMLGGTHSGTQAYAIIAQDCYGGIGDAVGVPGTHPMTIDGCTTGVQISRDSVMYARGITFGDAVAVGRCIESDRIARVREQGNTIGAAGFTVEYFGGNGITQIDNDGANLLDATNTSFGDKFFPEHAGAFHSAYNAGPHAKGHNQYKTAAIAFPTDATRTNLTAGGGTRLFTMPKFWLFSETAKGEFTLSFLMNANESATLELTGDGSGAGDVIMTMDIPAHTADMEWTLNGWFTGPCDPGTEDRGRYAWQAYGRQGANLLQRWDSGFTDNALNDPQISAADSAEFATRLYITLGGTITGGGELNFVETKVNF